MEEWKPGTRVLIFTAHADDCEFFCGGFAAKLARAGAEITEVIATDNGRGSFELPETALVAASRDVEAREAARIIGKKDVHFLGYPDGFLDDTPKTELRRTFMRYVRRIRPDIVLSFDPFAPFETHPDHRHVAWAAVEAVGFAQLPLYHPEQVEEGLAPHLTPLRYWFAKNAAVANHVEDISETVDVKIASICAHASQIRMMIEEHRRSIMATGRHQELLDFFDVGNGRPVVEQLILAWARTVGAPKGVTYGEAFRLERATDLLEMLTAK